MKFINFLLILNILSINVLKINASATNNNDLEISSDDPLPTGGADCSQESDCNGPLGGECVITTTTLSNNETQTGGHQTTGHCVCSDEYADPDCSYERKDKDLAGGLEFLCFIGVGGVGNFYLGRIGEGIGQFFLCLPILIVWCMFLCCICSIICGGNCNVNCEGVPAIVFVIIMILIMLSGLIWSIVDGAMILQGKVNDGDGYALY